MAFPVAPRGPLAGCAEGEAWPWPRSCRVGVPWVRWGRATCLLVSPLVLECPGLALRNVVSSVKMLWSSIVFHPIWRGTGFKETSSLARW